MTPSFKAYSYWDMLTPPAKGAAQTTHDPDLGYVWGMPAMEFVGLVVIVVLACVIWWEHSRKK